MYRCDVKHSCVAWLIHMCVIQMCDMTHSYLSNDLFICETWPIHMCDMTRLHVWHDLFVCHMTYAYATRHMNGLYAHTLNGTGDWHDSCIPDMTNARVTWLVHVWHDAFRCDMMNSCMADSRTRSARCVVCITLQHIATHCNILQHALHITDSSTRKATQFSCIPLQYTATHCNTLQHTLHITDSSTRKAPSIECTPLQHTATHYNTRRV